MNPMYVCVREEWKKAHWCQTVLRCVFACGSVCVGILPCWSLKPIITVFCSKLKDNQEGGEEVLHLPISYPVEWSQLLWRRVFKLTGCGTESSSDVSVCASPKVWSGQKARSHLLSRLLRIFFFHRLFTRRSEEVKYIIYQCMFVSFTLKFNCDVETHEN